MPEAEKTSPAVAGRRLKVVATAIVVAIGVAYLAYAALYLATRVTPAPDAVLEAAEPSGGVSVVFIPQRVDPERENIQGVLRISVDREATKADVTVRVVPFLDVSQLVVLADQAALEQDATLSVEGEVRGYPFDSYTGTVQMSAADTVSGLPLPVNGGIRPIDGLTGWSTYVFEDVRVVPNLVTDSVTVERSLTTRVTVAILTTLVLALGAVAIALAWSVAVGRKESGFGEATWLAATIFSVVSVRNFMPGAPPIGAYVDALFIIPAVLVLFLSMTLLVVFWLARPTPEESE